MYISISSFHIGCNDFFTIPVWYFVMYWPSNTRTFAYRSAGRSEFFCLIFEPLTTVSILKVVEKCFLKKRMMRGKR